MASYEILDGSDTTKRMCNNKYFSDVLFHMIIVLLKLYQMCIIGY